MAFKELTKSEKENIQKSKQFYGKEIRLYTKCFSLLSEVLNHLTESINRKDETIGKKDFTVFAICGRIFNTSKIYLDLLMKGYHYDASILNRSLLENVYLMEYLIRDEGNIDKWLKGELKFSKVKKELGLFSNELFQKAYELFSDYIHSNIGAILSLASISYEKRNRSKGERRITFFIEPQFREDEDTKHDFFPSIGITTLCILSRNYGNMLDSKMKSRIKRFEKTLLE